MVADTAAVLVVVGMPHPIGGLFRWRLLTLLVLFVGMGSASQSALGLLNIGRSYERDAAAADKSRSTAAAGFAV
jgi:hypothetical protein